MKEPGTRKLWGEILLTSVVLVVLVLLLLGGARATTISPVPPPTSSSPSCPAVPLLPGSAAANGSLVALFQPGPYSGSTCALLPGGTLVGNQIILAIYTPSPVPNGTIAIAIEEFQTRTVQLAVPGPNNTTFVESHVEQFSTVWSNVSIPAAAGEAQEQMLTVPSVPATETLELWLLGTNLTVTIVTPGAGIAIPQNYPELLLHDFGFLLVVLIAFAVGIGIATAVRLRARHVEKLWPFGLFGIFASIGFGIWFTSNYPLSVIPTGSAPEAAIVVPAVLAAIYFWLALFPTEARWMKAEFPVAALKDGERSYTDKSFREFDGPNGTEYIGPGAAGAALRVLGVRTILDNRALNPQPRIIRSAKFRSLRNDVYGKYFCYAEIPGETKNLEVVPPKIYWLPWRKKARESIASYHAKELRGRVDVPTHLGWLLYVTPSRAFLSAVGTQGAVLVTAWIQGTLHHSKVGLALERVLVAYAELRVTLKAQAIAWGNKLAYALSLGEDLAGSPIAQKALEDLAVQMEAAITDETEWAKFLEGKVADDDARRRQSAPATTTEIVLKEAANPIPPDLRRRLSGGRGYGQ